MYLCRERKNFTFTSVSDNYHKNSQLHILTQHTYKRGKRSWKSKRLFKWPHQVIQKALVKICSGGDIFCNTSYHHRHRRRDHEPPACCCCCSSLKTNTLHPGPMSLNRDHSSDLLMDHDYKIFEGKKNMLRALFSHSF